MSVALDLNKQRVYIRGNIRDAYEWVSDFFTRNRILDLPLPFMLLKVGNNETEIVPHSDWTVEYDPAPLDKPWVRCV